jgi:hypothetical protein
MCKRAWCLQVVLVLCCKKVAIYWVHCILHFVLDTLGGSDMGARPITFATLLCAVLVVIKDMLLGLTRCSLFSDTSPCTYVQTTGAI